MMAVLTVGKKAVCLVAMMVFQEVERSAANWVDWTAR